MTNRLQRAPWWWPACNLSQATMQELGVTASEYRLTQLDDSTILQPELRICLSRPDHPPLVEPMEYATQSGTQPRHEGLVFGSCVIGRPIRQSCVRSKGASAGSAQANFLLVKANADRPKVGRPGDHRLRPA
jgi:hypothetical protein